MIVTTKVISIDPNYWFTLQTPKYMNLHKWDHSSSKQASTTYNYYIGIKRKVSSHIYNPISSPSLIRQRPEKSDKSLCKKVEGSLKLHQWSHSSNQESTYKNLQVLHMYQTEGLISYLQPYFLPKFDPPKAREKG